MTSQQALGELALLRVMRLQVKVRRFRRRVFRMLRLHRKAGREAQIILDMITEIQRRSRAVLVEIRRDRETEKVKP